MRVNFYEKILCRFISFISVRQLVPESDFEKPFITGNMAVQSE